MPIENVSFVDTNFDLNQKGKEDGSKQNCNKEIDKQSLANFKSLLQECIKCQNETLDENEFLISQEKIFLETRRTLNGAFIQSKMLK